MLWNYFVLRVRSATSVVRALEKMAKLYPLLTQRIQNFCTYKWCNFAQVFHIFNLLTKIVLASSIDWPSTGSLVFYLFGYNGNMNDWCKIASLLCTEFFIDMTSSPNFYLTWAVFQHDLEIIKTTSRLSFRKMLIERWTL